MSAFRKRLSVRVTIFFERRHISWQPFCKYAEDLRRSRVHRFESPLKCLDCIVAHASACSGELQFAVAPLKHRPRNFRLKPAAARLNRMLKKSFAGHGPAPREHASY